MKYIFKQVDNISGHNAETTIEFDAEFLPDILQHFEMFLRGSGFHPSGTLDFIPDEEYYGDGHEGMGSTLDDYPELKEEHEWTQTLRNDSEWPFPLQKESESTVMDWTAAQLIRPPKMEDVCPVCKIDMQTMLTHECWDNNCPKGKDAN
jgi:hypothetical protein